MSMRRAVALLGSVILGIGLVAPPAAAAAPDGDRRLAAGHSLRGAVTDENFYFVMADRFDNADRGNDRGGLPDDPLQSGYDPTNAKYYNGGDLKGLSRRLDYIQNLGVTSIWLTPSFKNKPVQPEDGAAGYHGYWITDFTQIDPHLGSNDDLRSLIQAAHGRGMKVYFDIITNHTADVVGYESGARQPYVSKDVKPYRDAAGQPFDDRDYAGTSSFPALDPATSFPYKPVLDPSELALKVPAWLNDVTLYHNRGDTTFVGENSEYGDFFGLDDLFTENPRVVQGMIDIYQTWIRDFGVDGYRIDTMKHVDHAFWQKFGPALLRYAHQQGKPEFFMFGEVFDTSRPFQSQYTTADKMQAVLDFPFQAAARDFASKSTATTGLQTLFEGDDWYTDADSNVYQMPTFLGNHDMGRMGAFVTADNPGAADPELVARTRLAHELMYFSRGNPVVYYGDEQGFAGTAGDPGARQSMFASQVPEYLDDDLLGTDATMAQDNFDQSHPLYQSIKRLAAVTKQHPALRNGAHQHRYASSGPGIYAFSRIDRGEQHEYVVALNNSEQAQTAAIPTYQGRSTFAKIYGSGPARVRTAADRTLTLTVPPLSAVVYQAESALPRSPVGPAVTLNAPEPSAETQGRMHVSATLPTAQFAEVTFFAKVGDGSWKSIGTDDNAPYQVFHDVSALGAGTRVQYRAVVLDNAGRSAQSAVRPARVPAPAVTIQAPAEGSNVRGTVEVRAVADPEQASHVMAFERRVDGGAWTAVGQDASSPVYTAFDDLSGLGLAAGATVEYRAILTTANGTRSTSPVRTVRYAGPPVTLATVHYLRPGGDYTGWGLHLWGDAVDPAVLAQVDWDHPWPLTRVEGGWAEYEIPLVNDLPPVNFIVHQPGGNDVPATREPGGDRSFIPIDHPEIWLVQGDPTVYYAPPTR